MPANTSPDSIEYPVSTDPVAPLETVFANMANSVQDAFDGFRVDWNDFENNHAIQTFRWADSAARAAQTGMVAGDVGYQVDTGVAYRYSGSSWNVDGSGPFCVVRKSANQNLSTSAAALTWNVEIADPYGMHDNSVNNTRITAPVAGVYEAACSVYNNNTSGMGTVYGRLNGTTDIPGSLDRRTADATAALPLRTVFSLSLSAGDYVEIMVLHATAAGNIAGGTTQGSAVLSMKRIG